MEPKQRGACIAPAPAASTCHLHEGRLPPLLSLSLSPELSAWPRGRAGKRAAPGANQSISKRCAFTQPFAAHRGVFAFVISWKFNLRRKSCPPCLPGTGVASCRAPQSLRQEGSSGQPRYRQPDEHMAKGLRQITPREDKSQRCRFLGYPGQTLQSALKIVRPPTNGQFMATLSCRP